MAQQFNPNREGKSGDWKCVVYNEPWNDGVKVFLVNTALKQVAIIEKGEVVMKDAKEGVSEPLMILPYFAWQSILQAMGSIEPDDNTAEKFGELKATKYHLEDMRKLLKVDKLQTLEKKDL